MMASTNAERVRRYKERKKAEREANATKNLSYLRTPFYSYLEDDSNWSSVELCLGVAGIEPPVIEDDRGPEHFVNEAALPLQGDEFGGRTGSIGRAEVLIEGMVSAAIELAGIVSNYKRQELKKRLAEIESSDLSDPTIRKDALAETVQLTKLLEQLDKDVRVTLPQWKLVQD